MMLDFNYLTINIGTMFECGLIDASMFALYSIDVRRKNIEWEIHQTERLIAIMDHTNIEFNKQNSFFLLDYNH